MSVLKRGAENSIKKCGASRGQIIEHIQYNVAILNRVVRGDLNKSGGKRICTAIHIFLKHTF